jgi:H+/Cl- antiporter ClcA
MIMLQTWLIDILIGVIATLVGSVLIWTFRRRINEKLTNLDVSTSEVLAWLMAFSIFVAIVIPLTDSTIKPSLIIVLMMIVIPIVQRRVR